MPFPALARGAPTLRSIAKVRAADSRMPSAGISAEQQPRQERDDQREGERSWID